MKGVFLSAVAIAGVVSLSASEVKVSSLGWNASDSTDFLQRALDSGATTVVVDRVQGPWVTRPLFARSNQVVLFEPGVTLEAKRGAFLEQGDCLFSCQGVTNVLIRGYGAVWRMHRADYDAAPYERGEWRHSLNILSSDRVTVEGLTLLESGGDGVYVGSSGRSDVHGPCSTDIVLRDLVCDRHYRQGMSIITVRNLLIERCVMRNTAGTAPAAGIDFEPNRPDEELVNCVMRDCVLADNEVSGIEIYLGSLDHTTKPISLLFENCRSIGNARGIEIATLSKSTYPRGEIRFSNCTFEREKRHALILKRMPNSVGIAFEDCRFLDCCADAGTVEEMEDVSLVSQTLDEPTTDGVFFRNCTIRQPFARDWISRCQSPLVGAPVRAVTGDIELVTPSGRTHLTLGEEWCRSYFVSGANGLSELPPVRPFDSVVAKPSDSRPGERVRLSSVEVWNRATYRFYAAAPGKVSFTGQARRLTSWAIKGEPRLEFKDSGGKLLSRIPLPPDYESAIFVDVPAAGFYTMDAVLPRMGFRLCSTTVPVALEVPEKGFAFLNEPDGDLHFRVRPDERFVVAVKGDDIARVHARIEDAAGTSRWERYSIGSVVAFAAPESARSGLWKLSLSRSRHDSFGECFVQLRGTQPELFLTKDKTW